MTFPILEQTPTRTCDKTYAQYRSFKPFLRDDFNKRCGYCDCEDFHLGGWRGFQIDHFKPKSKFPDHLTDYSNLIYSCSYCNGAKSNHWNEDNGFIDPCDAEYNNHLFRNSDGQIGHSTDQGKYIFQHLNLGLERHSIIWMLRKLEGLQTKVNELIDHTEGDERMELLLSYRDIGIKITEYTSIYRELI